ncbi:hypothetical protein ACS8UU_003551 [Vibrio parahaemolyticus]|uniref:hypothetical protein n=1 Tax=Vibrio parahaemolyticus TaxID=670 RepID=UPI000416D227|nr:hypothetical protein [Vibrio parahaemolyticus]EGQ7825436.1 hypothetical protein [Vibrio parahaemolyticus]EGR0907516.1 hypothetical protein [Vibrio parahaemolyticus]EGV3806704.1 hypothetical protein [Vibrio parahaemolyticus]EIR4242499.1 hypothetical protein [Vibrio parahaemolyticus]EJG0103266.1 hypothetical protein [Vibrio parahaemolyticus]
MLDSLINKKVIITTGPEGEESIHGQTIIAVEGTLIKLESKNGEQIIINTASCNFFSIQAI